MLCKSLVQLENRTVACGQCMPCRINRNRTWTGKMLMEISEVQLPSYFLTLTYDDEHLPGESVDKADLLQFRERLRHRLGKVPRYFMVGEYGEREQRPHYHAILFGPPIAAANMTRFIQDTWAKGFTQTGFATPASCAYVAQYCMKKLTRKDDIRLGSRLPEFSQQSRRPALGDSFVTRLGEWLHAQPHLIATVGDVPSSFRSHGKFWPLSDRHRRMMRRICELPETATDTREQTGVFLPPQAWDDYDAEMQRREVIHEKRQARQAIFATGQVHKRL